MRRNKVVVVDDSALMRMVIADIIEEDSQNKVIARLKNGRELIENISILDPDVITLDIEMPEMDGFSTLKELKSRGIKYPIIMLSSLSKKGSIETMKCLELGAVDFVEKLKATKRDSMKYELITKIKGIVEEKNIRSKVNFKKVSNNNFDNSKGHLVEAVVIGASTGGPKALQKVLTKIDEDINVPIFVVQHMPNGFTKAFSERLNKMCKLKVVEAENGVPIEKNTIYIAQGGYHMIIDINGKIKLSNEPPIWGVRPAVDKLFESAVKVYKGNILSVILTGMGKDGAKGTEIIKNNGGITIAEDRSTCTIYGMPKAAYETGKVDLVLPLHDIPEKINQITKGR